MRIEQHIVAAWATQISDKIIMEAIDALQKMDSDEMCLLFQEFRYLAPASVVPNS